MPRFLRRQKPERVLHNLRQSPRLAVLAVATWACSTAGCMSNRYVIDQTELQRLARLPPEQRGQVRVVQALGADASPQPMPPRPPAPEAYAAGDAQVDAQIDAQIDAQVAAEVQVDLGPPLPAHDHMRGGPAPVAPAGAAARRGTPPLARPAYQPKPSGGGSVGHGVRIPNLPSPGSGGGGGDAEALVIVAVVVVAIAVLAVGGLAVTEGIRYDGFLQVPPEQPIHLEDDSGNERLIALWELTPYDLAEAREASIVVGEGQGFAFASRRPLDRRGFTLKLDLGLTDVLHDGYTMTGVASNIQLGYFLHQKLGILATAHLSGGNDALGRPFAHHEFGLESQFFPLRLGPLHFGGYLNANAVINADQGQKADTGPGIGLGGLVEIELATRLALTLRGGYATANLSEKGWVDHATFALGLAIY